MLIHAQHLYLQNCDWLRDQGLHLDMINSRAPIGRNEFYDKILMGTVKNRKCIDIGFGTGILSMLALKHGAIHVDAWEMSPERYELGQTVIKNCNLGDLISLNFGRFDAQQYVDPDAIVVHEIIGNRIWEEGLRDALPIHAYLILPSTIMVEFEILSIKKKYYRELFFPKRIFDPKVDLLPGAVECIQGLIDATPQVKICRREYLDVPGLSKTLGSLQFYKIDFNQKTINDIRFPCDALPLIHKLETDVTVPDGEIVIYYPKITIANGDELLHWSYCNPLLIEQSGKSIIVQDFTTGKFSFSKKN